jgi:hypothetical protein
MQEFPSRFPVWRAYKGVHPVQCGDAPRAVGHLENKTPGLHLLQMPTGTTQPNLGFPDAFEALQCRPQLELVALSRASTSWCRVSSVQRFAASVSGRLTRPIFLQIVS